MFLVDREILKLLSPLITKLQKVVRSCEKLNNRWDYWQICDSTRNDYELKRSTISKLVSLGKNIKYLSNKGSDNIWRNKWDDTKLNALIVGIKVGWSYKIDICWAEEV